MPPTLTTSEHAQKSHGCHGTQGRKQQHSRVTASPPRWSTTRPLRLPDARIKLRWIGPAHIKGSPVTSARLKISPFREVVIDGSSTDGSAVRAVAVSTVAASLSSTQVDTGVRMNGFDCLVCIRARVFIIAHELQDALLDCPVDARVLFIRQCAPGGHAAPARLEDHGFLHRGAASGVFLESAVRREDAAPEERRVVHELVPAVRVRGAASSGLIDRRCDAVEGEGVDRELCR